jgi:hypothetical protein
LGSFSAAGLAVANFGHASGWTSDNQFHRELADVNGDGRADIIGFGIAGTLVSFARADGTFSDRSPEFSISAPTRDGRRRTALPGRWAT